jgi:hypothetical protein
VSNSRLKYPSVGVQTAMLLNISSRVGCYVV